jgi:hypothetical protein
MAQAWHKPREQLGSMQGGERVCWRASKYVLAGDRSTPFLAAAPDASWERCAPFDWYKPRGMTRDVDGAGPHIMFLRLKELWQEQPDLFEKALILFAERYGLLGAFEEDYQQHPVFPIEQMLVAPEAVIDGEGRLRRVDPSTEGKELLIDLLEPKGWRLSGERDLKAKDSLISLPSDIQFAAKQPDLDSFLWPRREAPRQLALWTEIRNDFGALLVLDEEAFKGVSVP